MSDGKSVDIPVKVSPEVDEGLTKSAANKLVSTLKTFLEKGYMTSIAERVTESITKGISNVAPDKPLSSLANKMANEFKEGFKSVRAESPKMIDAPKIQSEIQKAFDDTDNIIKPIKLGDRLHISIDPFKTGYERVQKDYADLMSSLAEADRSRGKQATETVRKNLEAQARAIDEVYNKMQMVASPKDAKTSTVFGDAIAKYLPAAENAKRLGEEIKVVEDQIEESKSRQFRISQQINSNLRWLYKYEDDLKELETRRNALSQADYEAQRNSLSLTIQRKQATIDMLRAQQKPVDTSYLDKLKEQEAYYKRIASDYELNFEYEKQRAQAMSDYGGQLRKAQSEANGIVRATNEMLDKEAELNKVVRSVVGDRQKERDAVKEEKTAEEQAVDVAKERQKQVKASAQQQYYLLRAVKMVTEQLKQMSERANRVFKSMTLGALRLTKALLRMALGVKLFSKNVDNANKAHKGFLGSLKIGFMTVLKYTLGIRSLYFMVNKIRHAMSEGMKALATQFDYVNSQMSSIATSLSMMKVATAAAVQPLLRVLAPALEKISAAFERATYAIASFFATLTGQTFVYRAIRAQEAYTDALNGTAGAAEKARTELSEFNKLNVLHSDKDSGGGAGGGAAAQIAEVATEASVLAEKVKDIFSKLFEPIKKAWEKEGKFVMDSWKFALQEIKNLIVSIGKDFLDVWGNNTGVKIWEDILHIVGDIGLIFGFLAQQIEYAWNKNKIGKKILEDIQNIIAIIIEGIRVIADLTVGWAHSLDFYPLFEAAESFLTRVTPLVQKLVDILVDYWRTVVLPFKKYIIEEGLPLLLEKLGNIAEAVNEALDSDVVHEFFVVWEQVLELGWEVFCEVIEDIGLAFADIIKSDNFRKFIDWLKEWVENANPEQLAKDIEHFAVAISGLVVALKGLAILGGIVQNILTFKNLFTQGAQVKAMKDVTSATNTLTAALAGEGTTTGATASGGLVGATQSAILHLDAFSPELITVGSTIAGIISIIAGAVLNILSFSNACKEGITVTNELGMVVGLVAATIGAILLGAPAAIAAAVAGVILIIENLLAYIQSAPEEAAKKIQDIGNWIGDLWENFEDFRKQVGEKIGELGEDIGRKVGEWVATLPERLEEWKANMKTFIDNVDWSELGVDIVKGILTVVSAPWRLVITAIASFVENFIKGFREGFEMHSPSKLMEPEGENIIKGAFEGITSVIRTIGTWLYTNVVTPFMDALKEKFGISGNSSSVLSEIGENLIQGLKDGISKKWDALKDSVKDVWQKVTDSAKEKFDSHSPSRVFMDLGENIMDGMKNGLSKMQDAVNRTMQNISNTVINTAKNLLNMNLFRSIGNTAMQGIMSGLQSMQNMVINAMMNIANNVVNIARNLLNQNTFISIGMNLINGLRDGLLNSMNNCLNAVRDVANNIVNTARNAFQIHSPSKVFMQMGEYITEGLVEGIEDDTSNPFDIMLDNANSSIDAIISRFDDLEARMTQINAIQMLSDNIRVPDIAKGKSLPTSAAFTKVMMSADSLEQTSEIEDDIITVIGLMKRQNTLLEQLLDKDVSINSKDAFNAVRSEANSYFKRTGNAAFAM